MNSDDDLTLFASRSRALRASTLVALSMLVLAAAGIGYVHPNLKFGDPRAAAPAGGAVSSRQLAAVDFVTPAVGWVVLQRESHAFDLLHTADAGETWQRQLGGSDEVIGEYLRFFDASRGMLVLLGTHAAMYQTSDGGTTWAQQPLTPTGGYLLSADFVDPSHGWLLAQAATEGEVLLRTVDGGKTWLDLGSPVAYSDWAYRVVFTSSRLGWLYARSSAPYAYRSEDAGTSWRRIALPSPSGGWQSISGGSLATGPYLVAPHPTAGEGVVATVTAEMSTLPNRLSDRAILVDSPVRSVRTFAGGGSVTSIGEAVSPYSYPAGAAATSGAGRSIANQFQLSSVDGGASWKASTTPSIEGAVGYLDAVNWWWIGTGVQSRSSDAGSTWSPVRGLLVPTPLPESLQIIDATHLWFGSMVGARPLVEATDDGGIHWTMQFLPVTP